LGVTPAWALPYPQDSDPPDIPGDIKKLADATDSALTTVAAIVPFASAAGDGFALGDSNWRDVPLNKIWSGKGVSLNAKGQLVLAQGGLWYVDIFIQFNIPATRTTLYQIVTTENNMGWSCASAAQGQAVTAGISLHGLVGCADGGTVTPRARAQFGSNNRVATARVNAFRLGDTPAGTHLPSYNPGPPEPDYEDE
jgi:hypothetical protein